MIFGDHDRTFIEARAVHFHAPVTVRHVRVEPAIWAETGTNLGWKI